jgi:multidrug efflux pump subunit AcrB
MAMGGDAEGSGEANTALLTAAPIGMLLLLFFLLLQFNSFRRVGIILLTVPLATVGIFPGLVLSGSPFGFQSLLGVIALVGIVVNNAIVLLDVMDRELEKGRDIRDAMRNAVEQRTRPILLTTATTVAGLLPLAFSSSTLWPPMAWAIISGLLASTVLTLLVIPAVCTQLIKVSVPEPENAPA